jgi:cytochrome b6-f complex iron-sulfur subunit
MTEPLEGKPAEATTPAKPAAPPAAPKPAAKPAAKSKGTEEKPPHLLMRRRLIWGCIWGYLGVNFFMFLRFFFPRALFEPKTVFSIGSPADFTVGVVDTKFQKDYRIWVVRTASRLFVIYARCTHLGCTPDWKESERKFKCPCHGSGFDNEGVNFEGPAPRPMDRAQVTLDPTGQIVVDIGKLFVREKGVRDEFDNPGAYLPV